MTIKLNRKVLFLAAVSLGGILLSVGTVYLCQPFVKAAEQDRQKEAAYVQETLLARDLLASQDVKGVFKRLVDKERIASVKEAVSRLAHKNNVALKAIRPPFTISEEGKAFSRVLFDFQLTASLKEIGEFLAAVRSMPEGLMDVDGFRFLPHDTKADLVTGKITFILFVAKNYGQK